MPEILSDEEITELIAKYNPYPSVRDNQAKAISDILKVYDPEADDTVLVQAPLPTAAGKTLIATILGKILSKELNVDMVLGTTPLVDLIYQYRDNPRYRDVPCLVGKANYKCILRPGNTAEDCIMSRRKKNLPGPCKTCEYLKAKRAFDNASFAWCTFDRMLYDPSVKQRINALIVDESARCESSLRKFSDLVLPKEADIKDLRNWLQYYDYELNDELRRLETLIQNLALELEDVDFTPGSPSEVEKEYSQTEKDINRIQSKIRTVETAMGYMDNNVPYMIHTEKAIKYDPIQKANVSYDKNTFKLITANVPFSRMIKNVNFVLLMSGTPATELITAKPFINIESIHPIPIENRRCLFITSIGSMSFKTRDATAVKMAPQIANIWQQYDKSSLLVHCGSYPVAKLIYRELVKHVDEDNVILQIDAKEKEFYDVGTKRQQFIGTFRKSGKIGLSIEFNEGIDLEGTDYKAQVIAKLPAHPWLDQYVVKRNEYDTAKFGSNVWYDRESANKLMQSYGRICRTPTDTGVTYVLDKAVYSFWKRYQNKYFYKWFNNAVTVM
jgi:hypothetical protein